MTVKLKIVITNDNRLDNRFQFSGVAVNSEMKLLCCYPDGSERRERKYLW